MCVWGGGVGSIMGCVCCAKCVCRVVCVLCLYLSLPLSLPASLGPLNLLPWALVKVHIFKTILLANSEHVIELNKALREWFTK